MKTNKSLKFILGLLFSALLLSCNSNPNNDITNRDDYQSYLMVLESHKISEIEKEIQFWQSKDNASPNQPTFLIKLANQFSLLFEVAGNINDLYIAEELFLEANKQLFEQNSGVLRAIAKNYISQHRFKEALSKLEKAYELGEKKMETEKMLFDVHMELGNYDLAYKSLNKIKNLKDFDYLIRAAKWNDHKGQLDDAITLMEKAKTIAEDDKNEALKVWVYSNIADFYGHAGRIQDSYTHYLKTLEIDNNNSYALKGIAWIAFSHERNTEKAMEIVKVLEAKHKVPDLFLLKAEIAEYQNNLSEKDNAIKKYKKVLASNDYGDMYNKYNVLLMSENPIQIDEAIKISEKEIENRPTPESYDLLAWSYYKKGDFKKALEVAQMHTINKSFEPSIMFHNAKILKANNILDKHPEIKKELLASVYELGPVTEKEILKL
ncbi:tetratricopeptide repeat protein [Flavobacterium sp.]|uniref:tetratricopeptide repeat protein n=1 Tax=Flavobacterium sp. TaxID=239 RepID=UPI003F6A0D29